jgi:tyrosinase
MPIHQKKDYITAVLCLNKKPAISEINGTIDRFSDFIGIHNVQTPYNHFVGHFLLWHRYHIATYEIALREECGYTGGQPYWDWSLDAEPENPTSTRLFGSEVFSPNTGFGGNGAKVDPKPEENPFNLTGGTGRGCFQSGPFVKEKFSVNYPTPHCLKRDFMPAQLNVWADPKRVQRVLEQPHYTSMAREVEGTPSFDTPNIHGGGHFGVGGVLGQAANAENSPGEPIFYLHHGNIDHIFWT